MIPAPPPPTPEHAVDPIPDLFNEVTSWSPEQGIHPTGGYDSAFDDFDDFGRREVTYRLGTDLHREDGPAQVLFRGKLPYQWGYYRHGRLHREGGPAKTVRHSRHLSEETYAQNGKFHRLDGPAFLEDVEMPELGKYYIGGMPFTERDHDTVREIVEGGAPLEWALAYLDGKNEE